MPIDSLEVIQALGSMPFIPGTRCLQLHQQHVLDHQVGKILTDHDSVIGDRKAALLHDAQPRLEQFVCQGILINLLKVSRTKCWGGRPHGIGVPIFGRCRRKQEGRPPWSLSA